MFERNKIPLEIKILGSDLYSDFISKEIRSLSEFHPVFKSDG